MYSNVPQVPVGPWLGSEGASEAGQLKEQGYPAGEMWGLPQGDLDIKKTLWSTAAA